MMSRPGSLSSTRPEIQRPSFGLAVLHSTERWALPPASPVCSCESTANGCHGGRLPLLRGHRLLKYNLVLDVGWILLKRVYVLLQ